MKITASENFIKILNLKGMNVKYIDNRDILCYLKDALDSKNEKAVTYIICICLYNDDYNLLKFINNYKGSSSIKDFAIRFIERQINYTILELHEINDVCIWVVNNFPEKVYDDYKVLLEYGYEDSVDWVIKRIFSNKNEIYKVLDLAIESEVPSSVMEIKINNDYFLFILYY